MDDEEHRVNRGWHALLTDVLGLPGAASWLLALDRPLSPGAVARWEATWTAAVEVEAGQPDPALG